jgi:CheY-like chemotaxis protein
MRILVVDDDEDVREVMTFVLGVEGHDCVSAANGLEALALLRGRARARPQVILLDLMMPELDGVSSMRALRADPDLARIPVIVLSGHPSRAAEASS